MIRFSYLHLPAYPIDESLRLIQTADDLGFYAAYAVDETWWKDSWLLFAAAARQTKQIRLGPNVTHVIMRDPAHVVQMLATLDDLSGGRADCVISFGNQSLLPQHGIDIKGMKPLSRVVEAQRVMRLFLDTGTVTYEGDFFKYAGLWTLARPVQHRVPIKLGAMGGPRSFEVGGEFFDGVHQAIGCSRETYEYMMEHVKAGAERAGRDWRELDLGAWVVWACGEDSAAAKETARIMVAFYLASMPERQLARHGITPADLKPIFDAFAAGDVQKALDLTSPGARREAVDRGYARGVRREAPARHPADGDQPRHRSHRRPVPREGVHRPRDRELPGHAGPAPADPRPGHARARGRLGLALKSRRRRR